MANLNDIEYEDFSQQTKTKLLTTHIKVLNAILLFAIQVATLLCPVRFGRLRGSITSEVDEDNLEGHYGTNVEYGPYVELGTGEYAKDGNGRQGGWYYFDEKLGKVIFTKGQKPQPFLEPVQAKQSEMKKIAVKIYREELD